MSKIFVYLRMSGLRKILTGALVTAVLVAGGMLAAQPDSGDRSADATPEIVTPNETLSPAEMRASVAKTIDELRGRLERFVELRKLARDSEDIIKLNCVNDKMLLFKQLVNITEEAQTNMAEAIAQGDEAGRNHNFNQVRLAKEKADELRREAEECIGREMVFLGPTQLQVTSPDIDPFNRPFEWFDLDDPKYATPFN